MGEVLDLGDEIFGNGGELRGGEINFLGRLMDIVEGQGNGRLVRYAIFQIDDNYDTPDDCTVLAVATHQTKRQLRPFIEAKETGSYFMMSVDVERIAEQTAEFLEDEDDATNRASLRPVLGHLHLRTKPGDDMDIKRAKFILSASAIAMMTYNAARRPIHVHFICIESRTNDAKVSRDEKARRIDVLMATLDRDGKAKAKDDAFFAGGQEPPEGIDGQRRTVTLRDMFKTYH